MGLTVSQSRLPLTTVLLGLMLVIASPVTLRAHPAPSLAYDPTVLIHLTPKGAEIRYLLDVESVTVQFDLRHLLTRDEYAALRSEADVHAAFQKTVGPMLAERLLAFQGGRALALEPGESKVEILDHLRFTFAFRAKWEVDRQRERMFGMEMQRSLPRGESYSKQKKGRLDRASPRSPFFVRGDRDDPPDARKARPRRELTEAEKNRLCRIVGR